MRDIIIAFSILFTFQIYAQADSFNTPVVGQWSKEKINQWYAEQPWLVGCNYYPASAINQIEMWQASTWDPKQIDKELAWAESIGMNTLRVFLHDMVWAKDEKGLYKRMNQFLEICKKHGIRPWFVFFDDCHFPSPKLGEQPLPVKGYHNSGWVNCPSRNVAIRFYEENASKAEIAQLKGYVQKTIKQFKNDPRILMWELYNEPGRGNGEEGEMTRQAGGKNNMGERSNKLVYQSWVWAREINPSQPITSCTEGSVGKQNIAINLINADIYSIHGYQNPIKFERMILDYKKFGRPIIVTEWLARPFKNTVQDILPILKKHNVGSVNWGFVSGKTGTVWPWSSRIDSISKKTISLKAQRDKGNVVKPGEIFPEPKEWFHDLFRIDGTAYSDDEIKVFRKLTQDNKRYN